MLARARTEDQDVVRHSGARVYRLWHAWAGAVNVGAFAHGRIRAHEDAVAYYIGTDPALRRRKDAVQIYAASHRLRIVRDFWDGSSDTAITRRTGLAAMLAYVLGGGCQGGVDRGSGSARAGSGGADLAHVLLERNKVELVPIVQGLDGGEGAGAPAEQAPHVW